MNSSYSEILQRIQAALGAARDYIRAALPLAALRPNIKSDTIRSRRPIERSMPCCGTICCVEGEGWLSEESCGRLFPSGQRARVGRRSAGWHPRICHGNSGILRFDRIVENGEPVAGGICNPATEEIFIGAIDAGVLYNGKPAHASQRTSIAGASALASRTEIQRGEWKQFENSQLQIRPMGSVAYKLALVGAGLADTTFTLTPKNEWDVAAGAASF